MNSKIYLKLLSAIETLESALQETTVDQGQLETDIQRLYDMVNSYKYAPNQTEEES